MSAGDGYPRNLEHAARLRSGAAVWIRPIRPEDAPRLSRLYDHLSRNTAYQRFFTVLRRLPPDWARFLATVDYRTRLALVAEPEGPPAPQDVIGVARYEPAGEPGVAEIALVVQDAWQDQGLGSILLQDLVTAAGARGVREFRASVLADNARMLHLLARDTEIRRRRVESGVVELAFVPRPRTVEVRPGA